METKIVGNITFDGKKLNIYSSLDEPLFRAKDIAKIIGYSDGNVWNMLEVCEKDEKLTLSMLVAGQTREVSFVTELGLYNILSQSRKPIARKWRRVVHLELVRIRKANDKNITEQFYEWDHELDTLYYDEETKTLMQSVTVQGGDVEQVPYEGGKFTVQNGIIVRVE